MRIRSRVLNRGQNHHRRRAMTRPLRLLRDRRRRKVPYANPMNQPRPRSSRRSCRRCGRRHNRLHPRPAHPRHRRRLHSRHRGRVHRQHRRLRHLPRLARERPIHSRRNRQHSPIGVPMPRAKLPHAAVSPRRRNGRRPHPSRPRPPDRPSESTSNQSSASPNIAAANHCRKCATACRPIRTSSARRSPCPTRT